MDFVIPDPAVGAHRIGSCHTVPFPPEVGVAFVSVSTTRGAIAVRWASEQVTGTESFRAASPLHNLNNAGAGGNVVIAVSPTRAQSALAVATFTNDSKEDGEISVVAGASFSVPANQPKVAIRRSLPAGQGTTVTIVFSSPG